MTVLVGTQPSPDMDSSLSTAPPNLVVIIPDRVRWPLRAGLIHISLVTRDVEHFKYF